MSRPARIAVPGVVALVLVVLAGVWLAGRGDERTLPDSLCGTRVGAEFLEPLLPADGDVSQDDGVDRNDPKPSSWCLVTAGGESALRLRFAWHSDRIDPLRIAESHSSVSFLEVPERVKVPKSRAVIGNNGAIATAPCTTAEGSYFTLSVLLDGVDQTRVTYRPSLEKFLRSYFPATLDTLDCD
ncbi:hypothetical protein ACWC10_09370 [Streptomyces sp. NPDC001595]|uniref:hypothetical protein n=1 Tax=Streptomyces sp. NPDC001532 TaxID=3154520 RepID=UPI003321D69F